MDNACNEVKHNEIRIRNVRPELHEEITNIAKNSGHTLSGFLRFELHKIAKAYPQDMKVKDEG